MKNKVIKSIIFILCISLILSLSIPIFAIEEFLGTEDDYEHTQEKYEYIQEKLEAREENAETETSSSNITNKYTDYEIDLITNVVMHEVGALSGNISIYITYANGTTYDYSGTNIIHKIHAQVLLNQYNSSIFPESLSTCISWYWASYLTNQYYYNRNNSTWQTCRADVIETINNDFIIPSNVFAATCDPYFASYYPGYSLYAAVYWNTDWYSGTFYYYQYNN